MAGEKIMFGRTVQFTLTPWAGSFGGTPTLVTMCLAELPEVGQDRPEVEITNTCSTAEEYIAGLAAGSEFSVTGFFRAGTATDFGVTATLLQQAKSGAIIGIKDNSAQFAAPIIFRFDVTSLGWKFLGGSVKDGQKWMFRGRITGDINVAST